MKPFDVCLSFAGEDREYVSDVANILNERGVSVFYDKFHETYLWGKDLYAHFSDIYQNQASYCVMFISKYYKKPWTEHERKNAQARVLFKDEDYILPARFDDTEIPGILPTTGYIDLRSHTASEFAEIIIEKINQTQWEYEALNHSSDPLKYNFYSDNLITDGIGDALKFDTFQTIPFDLKSKTINDVVDFSWNHVFRLLNKGSYWTLGSDTEFDRLYATSSVLTFLLQLGLDRDHPLIERSLVFLRNHDEVSLDNRSNIFFQIAFHLIEEDKVMLFLDLLKSEQRRDQSSPIYGSFLFPQEDTSDKQLFIDTWQQYKYHKDGASFHACHIADYLLHLQSDFKNAKVDAAQIIDGIKHYMWNSFKKNSGFLLNRNFEPTTMTLYAYALAPALHLALPHDWKDCVKKCIDMLKEESNLLARCFGILNLAYLSNTNNSVEVKKLAVDYISYEMKFLWDKRNLFSDNARDLSIWGRSFIYGYRLLSPESGICFSNALNIISNSYEELPVYSKAGS